jgi:2-amino-4-hydroxy-6-hydroxymethyldihydropteridine diphosphokinase
MNRITWNGSHVIQTFWGIGSNLGDREKNFAEAIFRLAENPQLSIRRKSRIYETDPVGFRNQPAFLNAVVEIDTVLDPLQFLRLANNIENSMGRRRDRVWGPRTIDLDLLLYGTEQIRSEHLTVPHPRMDERKFVLIPLLDLEPLLYVPGFGDNVQNLLSRCRDASRVMPYTPKSINWESTTFKTEGYIATSIHRD